MTPRPRWRARLHEVIFESDTPAGRAFDLALLIAILVSVAAVMLESVPAISREYGPALRAIEWTITVAFTIEYVLLAGYNDSTQDAVALAKLMRGLHAKVNAIPFNEDANLPQWMKRPSDREIDRFVDTLVRNGVRVTVRRSKGRDIAAACGQLRGKEIAKSRATGGRPLRTASEPASEARPRR